MSQLKITLYTPESPLRRPGKLAMEMVRDLLASRELAWRLFVRDLSAMYRQSFLGYVWAFLPPIVTTLTFVFLSSQNIVSVKDIPMPYPAFVMIGTLLWQIFVDALNSPLKTVTNSKAMLAKINFPREALILSGLGEVLFNFLVRLALAVPVFFYYKLAVGPSILFVPLGVLGLLTVGLAFGILLTPLGVLYTDVGRGVALIAGFWMLLTPVAYPLPNRGLLHWNPVAPVLQTCRDWLSAQPATQFEGFLFVSLGALVFLGLGWILYRLSMPILIERMGG